MNTRTRQRITGSISLKVAVTGGVLIALGAGIDVVVIPLLDGGSLFGVWSGITALLGWYMILLSLTILSVLEFLRYTGY